MRKTFLTLSVLAGAGSAACASAIARTPPERPALEVPAPPTKVVEPPPRPEPMPEPVPDLPPRSAREREAVAAAGSGGAADRAQARSHHDDDGRGHTASGPGNARSAAAPSQHARRVRGGEAGSDSHRACGKVAGFGQYKGFFQGTPRRVRQRSWAVASSAGGIEEIRLRAGSKTRRKGRADREGARRPITAAHQ